jgi:hypothetical protein
MLTILHFAGDPVDEVVNNIHTFLRQIADDMDNNRLAVYRTCSSVRRDVFLIFGVLYSWRNL